MPWARMARPMRDIPVYWVDAFTDKPFSGNPAAVVLQPSLQPDDWMQNIAREMNLSETAFLLRNNEGFLLRWFTPEIEVKLCGHATPASAHVLYECGLIDKSESVRFFTQSGLLKEF